MRHVRHMATADMLKCRHALVCPHAPCVLASGGGCRQVQPLIMARAMCRA